MAGLLGEGVAVVHATTVAAAARRWNVDTPLQWQRARPAPCTNSSISCDARSLRVVAPSAVLAPFVRDLMIVEVGDEVVRARLPEPGLVLAIRYRGEARFVDAEAPLPDVALTGVSNRARPMRTSAGGGVVLARFRPGGAARFFAEPLHELFDASLALDELVPASEVDRVHARVCEAATDRERVAPVEQLLATRLRGRGDELVDAAVRAIVLARGALRIDELARRLAISQDPLEKRFRRAVGTSPKQLARLMRLGHAIDAYRPGTNFARLALDAGYFDQAHFNREFRALTGTSPGRYFR
jgi:AraC-like DNA-binding protein